MKLRYTELHYLLDVGSFYAPPWTDALGAHSERGYSSWLSALYQTTMNSSSTEIKVRRRCGGNEKQGGSATGPLRSKFCRDETHNLNLRDNHTGRFFKIDVSSKTKAKCPNHWKQQPWRDQVWLTHDNFWNIQHVYTSNQFSPLVRLQSDFLNACKHLSLI